MQALGTFIIDDDTIDCRQFEPTDAPSVVGAREAGGDRHRMLGALLHEVETTGTLIACAASIVNHAAARPDRARSLFASLPVWLPSPPPLIASGAESLIRAGLPIAIINRLHSLRIQLGVAAEATGRHCTAMAAAQATEAATIDDLVALWRSLSENTIDLLQALREQAPAGPETATAASPDRLLAAAVLGAWPCVGDTGLIEVPGWIERRGEGRYRLRLRCSLIVDGRAWPVETTDISRYGTGLAGLPQLQLGEKAVLRMGELTELAGSIVWNAGDQGGFRFDQPIASVADLARDLFPL